MDCSFRKLHEGQPFLEPPDTKSYVHSQRKNTQNHKFHKPFAPTPCGDLPGFWGGPGVLRVARRPDPRKNIAFGVRTGPDPDPPDTGDVTVVRLTRGPLRKSELRAAERVGGRGSGEFQHEMGRGRTVGVLYCRMRSWYFRRWMNNREEGALWIQDAVQTEEVCVCVVFFSADVAFDIAIQAFTR